MQPYQRLYSPPAGSARMPRAAARSISSSNARSTSCPANCTPRPWSSSSPYGLRVVHVTPSTSTPRGGMLCICSMLEADGGPTMRAQRLLMDASTSSGVSVHASSPQMALKASGLPTPSVATISTREEASMPRDPSRESAARRPAWAAAPEADAERPCEW